MRTQALLFIVVTAAALSSCEGDRLANQPELPDLSSPCRFRPMVGSFAASPAAIGIGQHATLTAEVNAAKSWTLSVAPGSSGNGALSPKNGTGPLRADFIGHEPGKVSISVLAENPECGFSTVEQTTVTVAP